MPCYCGQSGHLSSTDYDRIINLKSRLKDNETKYEMMEASVCAVMNELEKRDLTFEILSEAKKNGAINLELFWKVHRIEDEKRLISKLDEFSIHEQKLLKELLNKNKSL